MRKLSLDEKISIKGKLAKKGVLPIVLVQLDTAAAMRLHWACFGVPVAMHSAPQSCPLWRRRNSRVALMH
jgi:hypothetical protein